MKRTIAILLAVATMSFATSALAATGTNSLKKNGSDNGTFAASADAVSMPTYAASDEISFVISGATNGDSITLLSSKNDAEESNDTIQYIDEYDNITGTTQDVTYVIRDLDEGVYDLKIKVGGNDLYEVYYKVGSGSGIIYGDADGNGEFTAADVTHLARYLASWSGYASVAETADVNADGNINALDNIIIARSIAKWSGYTTLPYAN